MICNATQIDMLFLEKIKNIVDFENVIEENKGNTDILYKAKKMGFSDKYIGILWNMKDAEDLCFNERKIIYSLFTK